jgi:NAD-dependent deacetylase
MPDPNATATPDPAAIEVVAKALRGARRLLVVTGAGISAESGLPTYRGIGGLYSQGRTEEGYAIEDALSGEMLDANPALCWKYIAQIEAACRGAAPSDAHHILARLESRCEVTVLTQNVDGLHRAAGSSNVIEIHGDVHHLRCIDCGRRETVVDYAALAIPPHCACRGLIRPEVVLFGEMLPQRELARLDHELGRGFDVALSIGTTSVFPYIVYPVVATRQRGGLTVEVNPGKTSISDRVDVKLGCGAGAALRAIEEAL